jgi:hypothetical protein
VPQNWQLRLDDFDIKITVTVCRFGSQNQADYDLSVVTQNRQENEDSVRHALRSTVLFRVEASQATVFQSGLKTG